MVENITGVKGMYDSKDYLILAHLRTDARNNLTNISRKTGIPISTLFDRLKKYESSIIVKHTSLIDYKKLGYDIRINLNLKAYPEKRDSLKTALMSSQNVNNIMKINNGYDYIAECIFKNMGEFAEFCKKIEPYVLEKQEYFVLEDIKREAFLSDEYLARFMS